MSDRIGRVRRRLHAHSPRPAPADLRPAAVLLPIIVTEEEESLLFTRRSPRLRRQPGDISFPGGAVDPSDESPLATALRESREEVGLCSDDVTLLGQMDERGTVTGFRITPFVGVVRGPYPFRTNHEVEELFEVPLAALEDPAIRTIEQRQLRDGRVIDVYHYHYGEHDIWGITGRLVHELLKLIV
jgi:8-oxo-dGTP pyrophosphatase MutT (NUDIX family)